MPWLCNGVHNLGLKKKEAYSFRYHSASPGSRFARTTASLHYRFIHFTPFFFKFWHGSLNEKIKAAIYLIDRLLTF